MNLDSGGDPRGMSILGKVSENSPEEEPNMDSHSNFKIKAEINMNNNNNNGENHMNNNHNNNSQYNSSIMVSNNNKKEENILEISNKVN